VYASLLKSVGKSIRVFFISHRIYATMMTDEITLITIIITIYYRRILIAVVWCLGYEIKYKTTTVTSWNKVIIVLSETI